MSSDRPRARRRIDRGLLAASLAIATGLVIVGWGVLVGIDASEPVRLPEGLEQVSPVPDATQVLTQESVVADLASGYTGVLVVNGVEIETVNLDEIGVIDTEPGRQVDLPPVTVFEPGNSTLTFRPRRGGAVEEFESGAQEVTVIFWKLDEGRVRPSSFTWSFEVF